MSELTVSPVEFGIEESKAVIIEQSFLPKIVEREGLISVYENLLTKEITKEVCNEASTLRKKLVKVRTGIADIHKVEKALYLASGRYVDALKNKHTLPIEQMEEKLSEIEKYYENQEKQRIADLQTARGLDLAPYEVENVQALSLGLMSDAVWVNFLAGMKQSYENKKELERLAEAVRLEQVAAEQARIEEQRLENERLKAEQAAAELALAAERDAAAKVLAEQKAESERLLKIEREEAERVAKIQADKGAAIEAANKLAREKAAAELKAANDAAAKVAAELKAKQDAEAKAAADKLAAEKKAAKAPVKEKLRLAVHSLVLQLPESDITAELMAKFNGFKEWANKQIESL